MISTDAVTCICLHHVQGNFLEVAELADKYDMASVKGLVEAFVCSAVACSTENHIPQTPGSLNDHKASIRDGFDVQLSSGDAISLSTGRVTRMCDMGMQGSCWRPCEPHAGS